MIDNVNTKIPAAWKRSMVEPIIVGMPICLSLPTLLGCSSAGPSTGSKPAVTKRTSQKRSCLPSHTSRNEVAAFSVIYPKSEIQHRQGMMESFSHFYLVAVYHLGEQIMFR